MAPTETTYGQPEMKSVLNGGQDSSPFSETPKSPDATKVVVPNEASCLIILHIESDCEPEKEWRPMMALADGRRVVTKGGRAHECRSSLRFRMKSTKFSDALHRQGPRSTVTSWCSCLEARGRRECESKSAKKFSSARQQANSLLLTSSFSEVCMSV